MSTPPTLCMAATLTFSRIIKRGIIRRLLASHLKDGGPPDEVAAAGIDVPTAADMDLVRQTRRHRMHWAPLAAHNWLLGSHAWYVAAYIVGEIPLAFVQRMVQWVAAAFNC